MQLNNYIFKKAQNSGILSLPIPQRYGVAVYAVQGVIDNGGFEYLLENSFPDGDVAIDTIIRGYEFFGFEKEADILQNLYNGNIKPKDYDKYEDIFFVNSTKIYDAIDNY